MKLSQITISQHNQKCLDLLMEKKYFKDEISAARFAALYLIRNFDISTLLENPIDNYSQSLTNNKWHLSDVDDDSFIRKSLQVFDDRITKPDYALRAAISLGLDKIYERIVNNDWDILDLYEKGK